MLLVQKLFIMQYIHLYTGCSVCQLKPEPDLLEADPDSDLGLPHCLVQFGQFILFGNQ